MANETTHIDLKYSPNQNVNALLEDDGPFWNHMASAQGNVIYYSFADTGSHVSDVRNVQTLDFIKQRFVSDVLDVVGQATGIEFRQSYISNFDPPQFYFYSADIVDPNSVGLTATYSGYPYDAATGTYGYYGRAEIFLDFVDYFPQAYRFSDPDPAAFQILLHEIGHALGLKHPFEGTSPLPAAMDNTDNTLMSYNYTGGLKFSYQSLDLAALDWLYGGDGLRGQRGMNGTLGPVLSADNYIAGTDNADTLTGTAQNDLFYCGWGKDTINGGAGQDTAVIDAYAGNYTIQVAGTRVTLTSSGGGDVNVLQDVERVRFRDEWLAFDLGHGDNAAKALEFVGTLAYDYLDNVPLRERVLTLLDQGHSQRDLFKMVLDDGTVISLAGSGSDLDLVRLAYRNIVGTEASAAEAGELASYLPEHGGSMSRIDFLTAVAQLPLNDLHVDLVGHAASGLLYHIG